MSDDDYFMPVSTSSGKRKSGKQPSQSKRQQRQVPAASDVEPDDETDNLRKPPFSNFV